jgi:hypothetical protein
MKIAFRKWLILKDAFFVVGARKEPELLTKNGSLGTVLGEQASALHTH